MIPLQSISRNSVPCSPRRLTTHRHPASLVPWLTGRACERAGSDAGCGSPHVPPSSLTAAGNFYLAQLRQDDPPTRFAIDKNPLNFRHLGLIAGMLPMARIIHCRRDPRDAALSVWSQHFAHEDMAWSYDFNTIREYARGEAELMAHWRRTLPMPIFELDYETLVADPESGIAGIRRYLGLAAKAAPAPVDAADSITTASVWQARQEVHARSVGRWQRYREFLPELDTWAHSTGAAETG